VGAAEDVLRERHCIISIWMSCVRSKFQLQAWITDHYLLLGLLMASDDIGIAQVEPMINFSRKGDGQKKEFFISDPRRYLLRLNKGTVAAPVAVPCSSKVERWQPFDQGRLHFITINKLKPAFPLQF